MTNKEFEKFFVKFGNKFGEFEYIFEKFENTFEKVGREFENKFENKFEKWEIESIEGLAETFNFKNNLNRNDLDIVYNNQISIESSLQLKNIISGMSILFVAGILSFFILSNFYFFIALMFGYLLSGFVVFRKELFTNLKAK